MLARCRCAAVRGERDQNNVHAHDRSNRWRCRVDRGLAGRKDDRGLLGRGLTEMMATWGVGQVRQACCAGKHIAAMAHYSRRSANVLVYLSVCVFSDLATTGQDHLRHVVGPQLVSGRAGMKAIGGHHLLAAPAADAAMPWPIMPMPPLPMCWSCISL